MMTAFTSYTRSLCYDAEIRVEPPLTGLSAQDPLEIAIVGQACTVAEDATNLYFGVRARAMRAGDEHPPADPPPCMRSVRLRGHSIAIPHIYTMLPRVLRPIFELPDAALDVDLNVPKLRSASRLPEVDLPNIPQALLQVRRRAPPGRSAPRTPPAACHSMVEAASHGVGRR